MPRIELTTRIAAPPERCFDLARSVELHTSSTAATGERAIDGKTTGLLALGDEVTWQARHFGVSQTLTSRITAFDRPAHFRDSMVRGAFQRFDHDHYFTAKDGGTTMRDVFDYRAPLGPLGRLVERLVLTRYLRRFLEARNREIKTVAESGAWKQFLPVIALLLIAGCAARGRALWPGRSCPEEAVPLTPPTIRAVVLPAVIITGRASVVVCQGDRTRITDDVRMALRHELVAIVQEQHFHMVTVCNGETRSASEAAVAAEKRKAMIERLDRVVGGRIVRRVDCAFGWIEGL